MARPSGCAARPTRSPTASAWCISISCWSTASPCSTTSCSAPKAGAGSAARHGRATRSPWRPGAKVLEVEGLRVVDGAGQALLRDIAMTVRAGEIVGIAGIAGNGQSELLGALAGLATPAAGRIRLNGEDVTGLDARAR